MAKILRSLKVAKSTLAKNNLLVNTGDAFILFNAIEYVDTSNNFVAHNIFFMDLEGNHHPLIEANALN